MTKWMLLKFEPEMFSALNEDGNFYELTLRISYCWGLIKKTNKVRARVPYSVDAVKAYTPLLNKWVTAKQAKEIVNQRNQTS